MQTLKANSRSVDTTRAMLTLIGTAIALVSIVTKPSDRPTTVQ